jgi:predicted phosphodiesterase
MLKKNKSILVISDLHIPYQHKDAFDFLKEIKSVYKPDRIVNIGDELDHHAISFHDSDPELFSASDELRASIEQLKILYKMFPKMDLVESNHGSLVYRKQKHHGLPRSVFKSYNDMLEAPKSWKWHNDLTIKMSNGSLLYCHHGKSPREIMLSQNAGMSAVNGHYHEKFCINYWVTPQQTRWQMFVGCLIDNKSMAFAYNRNFSKTPIIGTGIILDGHPRLLPMKLDKKGRWIGKL